MVMSARRRPMEAQGRYSGATPEDFDHPTHVFLSGCVLCSVRGEIRAETLRAGDRLKTRDGNSVVVEKVQIFDDAAGSSAVQEAMRPINIRRGTLAVGCPKRDIPVTRNQPVIGGGHGATAQKAAKDLGGRVTTATLGELAPKLIVVTCAEPVAIGASGVWLGPNPVAPGLNQTQSRLAAHA